MADVQFLDAKSVRLRTTAGGLVSLGLGDTFFPKVDLHLAFPFSDPERFISVREPEGDEIGLIRHIQELDPLSQEAVRKELRWRYYTPRIQRIISYKEEFGHTYWEVETDRGVHTFVTRGRDQTVRSISERRTLIIDVSGNRYEIADLEDLDVRSREYLATLL
ncbi:MAG: DUF1854 domain-containing protein [Bacillota bacterium]|jgi:hypothetical protein|nr:DUF1854 domain-containing protein [Bacillota bacterium]HHT91601.1 DUF1854 domain-containing protein [Bacillota bacterium]